MLSRTAVQVVADLTAEAIGLKIRPRLARLTQSRGHAHIEAGWFSLPRWVLKRPEAVTIQYIVHEVCHFLNAGHGQTFRRIERKACQLWGIEPTDYGRAYPKSVVANGVTYKVLPSVRR